MHKWLMGFGLVLALGLPAARAIASPTTAAANPASADGDAGVPIATAVELSILPSRPRYGERVQVRARVMAAAGSDVPTGSVRFVANEIGGSAETLAPLDAAGYASMSFVPSSTNVNEIVANYGGDLTHTAST
ncbi:MAG TPA: Ig-like domain-containing protein, partial [Gemmatimonadaceae bacterium]|nr:Ig-like domain-containing protein [Gemmatimonadaceae bacterium]